MIDSPLRSFVSTSDKNGLFLLWGTKVTFDDHGHKKRIRHVIFGMDMDMYPISILDYDRFTSEVI